jgi:hypothetical protein
MRQDVLKRAKDPSYNPSLRQTCKLLMNSLYGKMLQRSKHCTYTNTTNAEIQPEDFTEIIFANGQVYTKVQEESDNECLHLGAFILAYSRKIMGSYFDLIGRENVIHTETDSIFCANEHLAKIPDSGDGLIKYGKQWGNMEVEFNDCKYMIALQKKCYFAERDNYGSQIEQLPLTKDEYHSKCCKMAWKGVQSKLLSKEKYQELYRNGEITFQCDLFRRFLFGDIYIGKIEKKITMPI